MSPGGPLLTDGEVARLGRELVGLDVHPDVDTTTADETAYKRDDGTRITVGQVAAEQAKLLSAVERFARNATRSGNPARSGVGHELLSLLGR